MGAMITMNTPITLGKRVIEEIHIYPEQGSAVIHLSQGFESGGKFTRIEAQPKTVDLSGPAFDAFYAGLEAKIVAMSRTREP